MNSTIQRIDNLTEEILALPCPTTRPPFETKIAHFFEAQLKQAGFQTYRQLVAVENANNDRVYERYNVLAEKGEGTASLLLFAHMDILPQHNPWFSHNRDSFYLDNRIYGPGVLRVKSGLIALLDAVTQVDPQGYKLKVALLVDGEGTQSGAHTLLKHNWLQDVNFALTTQPVYGTNISHQLNKLVGQTQNEFLLPQKQFTSMLENYLKDYLNVDMIGHHSYDGTPESIIFTRFASKQDSSFQVVALGPAGLLNDKEGEWVSIESIQDISNIFKFILSDFQTWLLECNSSFSKKVLSSGS